MIFEFTEDEKKNTSRTLERVPRELNRRERCLLIVEGFDSRTKQQIIMIHLMHNLPLAFISAVSADLRSARKLVRDAVLDRMWHPVVQDHFPLASHQQVVAMLQDHIARCDFLIHLVGRAFGFEPEDCSPPNRRSYTQIEYDVGCELQRRSNGAFKVFVLVCGESFPFDAPRPEIDEIPEAADKRDLQEKHRRMLSSGDALYTGLSDFNQLEKCVLKISNPLDSPASSGFTTIRPVRVPAPPSIESDSKIISNSPLFSDLNMVPVRASGSVVPFEITTSPMTIEQFGRIRNANDGPSSARRERTAAVTADDALGFLEWLNHFQKDYHYSLPIPQQWECAIAEHAVQQMDPNSEWWADETDFADSAVRKAFRCVRHPQRT